MPSFSGTFTQKEREITTNKKIRNKTCLEQQIYASQKIFTQPLVVMVETFRRSAPQQTCALSVTMILGAASFKFPTVVQKESNAMK